MKKIIMAGLLAAISAIAMAQAREPDNRLSPVKSGDQWTYKQFDETGQEEAAIAHFKIGWKTKQGALAVLASYGGLAVGPDTLWKMSYFLKPDVCMLDVASGVQLSPKRSCNLSPAAGTGWESETFDKLTRTHNRFTVMSREEIQVPAGIYQAFKIDHVAVIQPTTSTDVGEKHLHTIYWYSPEIRGMVKIVRDTADDAGILSARVIEELQSTTVK